MVSFRSAGKVSNYLLNAKRYPLEKKVSSFRCNKIRWQVCLNANDKKNLIIIMTKQIYNIILSKKCFIYLLTCKNCLIQYVGGTVGNFCCTRSNYKSNSSNSESRLSSKQRILHLCT